MKEQFYPYRFANNQNYHRNHGGSDIVIYQLQNQINNLLEEVKKINKKLEKNECSDNELYQSIIEYVDNKCDCNNNDRDRILTGNGTPSDNQGVNGSFYLDNDTGNYYIKVAGRWILRGNLRGPQGLPGSQILTGNGVPSNALGRLGDFYLDNISKFYYTKVGTSNEDAVWVLQGSLASNSYLPLVLPINFTVNNFPVISIPQQFPTNDTEFTVVANGTYDAAFWENGGISFNVPFFIYYTPVQFTFPDTYMTVTYTNLDTLPAGQVIFVELYFNIPGQQPPGFYSATAFGNFAFGVAFKYPNGAPPGTSQTNLIELVNFATAGPLILPAGSSFIITIIGELGLSGVVNSNITVSIPQ